MQDRWIPYTGDRMADSSKPIKPDAILWDFDGTLANSAAKNIAITRQILARVAPRLTGQNLPEALSSEAAYHVANHAAENWRYLYRDYFGMTEEEIGHAAPLWEPYQLSDRTCVPLFEGVVETITRLSRFPQGICSANATENIRQVLHDNGIGSAFKSVIGYEGLPHHQQKPAPDGGMKCLREIFGELRDLNILCVGDHLADVLFARGLAGRLETPSTVVSVVITHSGAEPHRWRAQPDLVIEDPAALIDLVHSDKNYV